MKTEIRSNWSHAILVCKKCGKKAAKRGAAFGTDRKSLPKALKRELGAKKGRKSPLGIVEVGCLDVCPKKGLIMVDSRTPGQWRIVREDADIAELAKQLQSVDA
ncbi:(2Fe-2S) ferredoxin domain-containing protein [Erythrobacter rubeus]|uniref:(2Fe-2S) ferredoxin domain-containing protein n=1 Tax=Erythrobacter rubeus TaxID=2760803 RepID=A0ABR8KMR0_9SPHN|nr:(2Fe-2S) ferredoxin domain-containing protein [Erythrobacter rubeus]MBD2841847.1 (2Fe-2S) ferredoxin domain-containing protein [Erythrobacter rubeus]